MTKKIVFDFFCHSLHNGFEDLPNFWHGCRGQYDPMFEPDGVYEKFVIADSVSQKGGPFDLF